MAQCEICEKHGATERPHISESRDVYLCADCHVTELESFPEIRERFEEWTEGLSRIELRQAIYEMRKDGLTFREISEYLPYGVSWVSREYREYAAEEA